VLSPTATQNWTKGGQSDVQAVEANQEAVDSSPAGSKWYRRRVAIMTAWLYAVTLLEAIRNMLAEFFCYVWVYLIEKRGWGGWWRG
jgi:hypothetical protein